MLARKSLNLARDNESHLYIFFSINKLKIIFFNEKKVSFCRRRNIEKKWKEFFDRILR